MDYYAVLGVSRDADADEIKKAYRKLSMECHPDHHPNDKEKEARFRDIAIAYAMLSDPEKRAQYDKAGVEFTPDEVQRLEREVLNLKTNILNRNKLGVLESLETLAKDPAILDQGRKLWQRLKSKIS